MLSVSGIRVNPTNRGDSVDENQQNAFIIESMRELLRKNPRYFLYLTFAALLFRLYFALFIPVIQGDSNVYANLADTLAKHHVYGLTGNDGNFVPTLIRLPGYPLFLFGIFRVFGPDNWTAVMVIQAFIDTITCLMVAALALRVANERVAKIAFALAVFCPFTANYVGTGLTESTTLFSLVGATLFAVIGFEEKRLKPLAWAGVFLALAILLRPDGGFLLITIGIAMMIRMWVIPGERRFLFKGGIVILLVSLSPLVPWAIRNWKVFHVFQPLVTRGATDPNEWEPVNFGGWVSTWMIDYATMEDILFKVSGEPISMNDFPDRAFSDAQEKAEVARLVDRYNQENELTPEMDAEFGKILQRHLHEHPFRIHYVVPFLRLTSMWLRPRTEMLPFDTHWWDFESDLHDSLWSIGLGLLNFAFIAIAMIGIFRGPPMRYVGLFVMYLLIRSYMIVHLGGAEQRYTLEGFPFLWLLGARYLAAWRTPKPAQTIKAQELASTA